MGVCTRSPRYANERVLEILLANVQALHSRQLHLVFNLDRCDRALLTQLVTMALLGRC